MRLSRGREMDRRILRLAIPNIISNITVPLLSIVDVGLAGRMDTADSIGAVAVASGVVNFVFWLFAFLRMGTTGFTAQAFGRSDVRAITRYLARGIAMAVVAALLLLIAAPLIERFGYLLASGSGDHHERHANISASLCGERPQPCSSMSSTAGMWGCRTHAFRWL